VIATVSTLMTVGAGLLMTVVDHENFRSIGPWVARSSPS
jgi:hypothetical protein